MYTYNAIVLEKLVAYFFISILDNYKMDSTSSLDI